MTLLSPRLQEVFKKNRTVCFGRFLMQIPATATVVYGPTEAETPIVFHEGQADKVAEHVAERLVEVEQERKSLLEDDFRNLPLFGKVIDGVVAGQKIVYGSKDQVSYAMYSFVPVGKDLFVQYLDTVLPESDRATTFNRIASQLRSRSEDEIPAEPGACIEGGFVPLVQKYERVTIGIRLAEFPDVHLSIDAHKNQEHLPEGNSPKLLREQAKQFAQADGLEAVFAHTKILRQQARQLGAWKGEEMALRTPAYKDDKDVHEFRFHSVGVLHDPLQPELDIRFDTGLKDNRRASVKPSITDEEALALWDKLITSIRIRQPSDATPTTGANPLPPFSSLARTGETCPLTGLWESTGRKMFDGDTRRLIKAGEPMPPSPLLSEPTLWQKLLGNRKREVPTTWKLVEYSDGTAALSATAGGARSPLEGEKPPLAKTDDKKKYGG